MIVKTHETFCDTLMGLSVDCETHSPDTLVRTT